MVFGCLLAQDVIRLTHDAFKANSSTSSSCAGNAHAAIKRFFWFLRVVVNCLVFAVVYGKQAGVGILPYISSLFSLCLIKCHPLRPYPLLPLPRVSFLHSTLRYGLDFLSRCFLPKEDPVHTDDSHTLDTKHVVDSHGQLHGLSRNNDHLGISDQFKSPLGRRMSTFALSSGNFAKPKSPELGPKSSPYLGPQSSPKLIPKSHESPELQPICVAELAGVKVLALPTKNLAQARATDSSLLFAASQPTLDFSLHQADRNASSPNPAHLISARKARHRMLPSVRSRQSPEQKNSLGDPIFSEHLSPTSPRSLRALTMGTSDVSVYAADLKNNSERSPKTARSPADQVMMIWRNKREEVRDAASRT